MANALSPPAKTSIEIADPNSKFREMLDMLAREVAVAFEATDVICQRKGITPTQYEKIEKNPYYIRVLAAFKEEWGGALNTEKRLQLKALFLLEHTLTPWWGRMQNKQEPLAAVNEGVKTLAKLAGVGERSREDAAGEKFMININLGGGTKITREVNVVESIPVEIEGTVVPPARGAPDGIVE